jgi:hypothetical protein
VEGLAATLTVDVQKDGGSATFEFLPGAGPGEYVAAFIPTATGDYTFRIYGQIEEEAIDESFRSSPNTFASVEPLTAIQFPLQPPDAATLQADVEDAEDAASTARALALGGIVVGVLGLLVGAAAWFRPGRSGPQGPGSAATTADRPDEAGPVRLVSHDAPLRDGRG